MIVLIIGKRGEGGMSTMGATTALARRVSLPTHHVGFHKDVAVPPFPIPPFPTALTAPGQAGGGHAPKRHVLKSGI